MPSGLTEGVFTSFGDYDQCLDVKSHTKHETNIEDIIYGKYCLVKPILPINDFRILTEFNGFKFFNNKTNEMIKTLIKENIIKLKIMSGGNLMTNKIYAFYYGICIPSQCEPHDVQNILQKSLYSIVVK